MVGALWSYEHYYYVSLQWKRQRNIYYKDSFFLLFFNTINWSIQTTTITQKKSTYNIHIWFMIYDGLQRFLSIITAPPGILQCCYCLSKDMYFYMLHHDLMWKACTCRMWRYLHHTSIDKKKYITHTNTHTWVYSFLLVMFFLFIYF